MADKAETDLLHGVEAIGSFLGLTTRQAHRWISTTDVPVIRTGRAISARKSSLTEWLAKREQEGRA